MIISLAASFIIGSAGPQAVPVDPDTQFETIDDDNLLTDPPAAGDEVDETTTDEAEATEEAPTDEADAVEDAGTPDSAEVESSTEEDAAEPDTEE